MSLFIDHYYSLFLAVINHHCQPLLREFFTVTELLTTIEHHMRLYKNHIKPYKSHVKPYKSHVKPFKSHVKPYKTIVNHIKPLLTHQCQPSAELVVPSYSAKRLDHHASDRAMVEFMAN